MIIHEDGSLNVDEARYNATGRIVIVWEIFLGSIIWQWSYFLAIIITNKEKIS